MTRTIRLAPAVLFGLAACTVDPNKIKPTVEDLCREAVSVMGDRAAECDGVDPTYARWVLTNYIGCVKWGESVSAGRIAYDESGGGQCISDLRSMSCDQLNQIIQIIFFGGSDLPGACAQGLVPAGYACTMGMDCASGTYCAFASACGGSCKAYANLGQICYDSSTGTITYCSSGLNCMPDPAPSSDSHCQAPILAGYGCPNGRGCADGLYCDTSSGIPLNYTCKTDPQSGQPCALGYICASGLYCNSNSASPAYKTCQPKMTSGACGQYDACLTPLYVCAGPSPLSWTSPGNCQSIAREGQYCQHGYNECVSGAYCKTSTATPTTGDPGVCTVFPGPPGACGSYGAETVDCIDSYCSGSPTGNCTAYIPLGSQCVSGGPSDQCGLSAYCKTSVTPNVCTAYCP